MLSEDAADGMSVLRNLGVPVQQPHAGDPACDRQLCSRRTPRHLLALVVTVA
jgi:hypothetical protein